MDRNAHLKKFTENRRLRDDESQWVGEVSELKWMAAPGRNNNITLSARSSINSPGTWLLTVTTLRPLRW